MRLEDDETLSNVAFNFNLRPYSSECAAAGNAVAGWVEIDLPGVVTQRARGAGVQHCTAAAPFRHRLVAVFEGQVSMVGGLLQLDGLGRAGDCLPNSWE